MQTFVLRTFVYRLLGLALAGLATLAALPARATDYPTKPVHWIVPYPPAGTTDILARLIGNYLSEHLGQSFIIENKPGGGNNIGTEFVARAPHDGYTLLLLNPANGINQSLYKNLKFDILKDIVPVAGITRVPNVMEVNPNFPAKTVAEFIAYAKANPGKVNMASAGTGGIGHLAGELFKMTTGVNFLHVPYRGNGPALTALLGGEVDVLFPSLASAIEYMKGGKLRGLAVTSAMRSDAMPELPSVGEFVAGYEISTWYGVGAPRGTPAEIIARLNNEINAGLAHPALKARFAELGDIPMPMTPAEFGNLIADQTEKLGRIVKFAGIKAE